MSEQILGWAVIEEDLEGIAIVEPLLRRSYSIHFWAYKSPFPLRMAISARGNILKVLKRSRQSTNLLYFGCGSAQDSRGPSWTLGRGLSFSQMVTNSGHFRGV